MDQHNLSELSPELAKAAETFRVFLPGQRVYIQAITGDASLLAMAELITTIPGELRLQLRWLASTALENGAPEVGQQVRLSTGEKRILYVVEGKVVELQEGAMTSAVIEVSTKCAGYNRRRHPRYELHASVKLGLKDVPPVFETTDPTPVDLSIGGFGIRLPDPSWQVGTCVCFELNVEAGQTRSGLSAVPAIRLQGIAEIRRRVEQPNGLVLLGFEFSDMSGYRAGVLQFWLDTFSVYLRES